MGCVEALCTALVSIMNRLIAAKAATILYRDAPL
jgi:hypothetical protein